MKVNQYIASTFLTTRVRQLLVAVLSVTFGISMYLFMNSFMDGVNNEQTAITFTSMAHIKIHNELPSEVDRILPPPTNDNSIVLVNNQRNIRYTEGIKNAEAIVDAVARVPNVAQVTTQLNQNIFIRNGVSKLSANLSGIEPATENVLFNTADYMVDGDFFDLQKNPNGIILGSGLALNLGVGTGDHVSVTTADGVNRAFQVIGTVETGATSADRSRAIVSIDAARQLFSKNKSYATDVLINVNDYNHARAVANDIKPLTNYKVEAWQVGNSQLDSANVLRDIIAIAVSLTILIVAGFGIYNIMNMTVNEKIKEIAILKAMGFDGRDVIEIFLTQSVVIGLLGSLAGLGLGNVIVRIVDRVPFEIGTLTTLPVAYKPIDYILAFSFGIIITFLAGYLPARKAARIDPVDILRG